MGPFALALLPDVYCPAFGGHRLGTVKKLDNMILLGRGGSA